MFIKNSANSFIDIHSVPVILGETKNEGSIHVLVCLYSLLIYKLFVSRVSVLLISHITHEISLVIIQPKYTYFCLMEEGIFMNSSQKQHEH